MKLVTVIVVESEGDTVEDAQIAAQAYLKGMVQRWELYVTLPGEMEDPVTVTYATDGDGNAEKESGERDRRERKRRSATAD